MYCADVFCCLVWQNSDVFNFTLSSDTMLAVQTAGTQQQRTLI
eukprot:COSAG06_NODE_3074_length_5891_cov_6.288847_2_plen_43_part_00